MTVRRATTKPLTIGGKTPTPLSALLMKLTKARACFVFAHGAGAGITQAFMDQVAAGLYEHGIATLRYQFPFKGRRSHMPPSAPRSQNPASGAEDFR